MSRIRTIKPEVLDDEKASRLSDRAWRLWVSTWVIADDHGRFHAHPRRVHSKIFWAREGLDDTREGFELTREALYELNSAGLIHLYRVNGEVYAEIPGWTDHQKVDHPSKPRYPDPSEGESITVETCLARSREVLGDTRDRPPTSDHRPPTYYRPPPARAKAEVPSPAVEVKNSNQSRTSITSPASPEADGATPASPTDSAYDGLTDLAARWNACPGFLGVIDPERYRSQWWAIEERLARSCIDPRVAVATFVEQAANSGIIRGEEGKRRHKWPLKDLLRLDRFFAVLNGEWSSAKGADPAPEEVLSKPLTGGGSGLRAKAAAIRKLREQRGDLGPVIDVTEVLALAASAGGGADGED